MGTRPLARRRVIALLGWAAAWPLAGHAEQPEGVRRIGWLLPWMENDPVAQSSVRAFVEALRRFGWNDGRNIRIDYRFAANDPGLFKTYAAELVGLSPNAIIASTPPTVMALRQQTVTIPIVFVLVLDPVGLGLVQSLARPGGNITGFGALDPPIMGKWLQLLKEVAPGVTRVAIVFNPDTAPYAPLFNHEIEAAAAIFGVTTTLAPVSNDAAIEEAVTAQAREPGGGLICVPDSFTITHRVAITASAVRRGLPVIGLPDLVRAGGLISYFYDPVDAHAQAASYIDRILSGASPADLPVQYPTKYSLIINLKTAKALGLTVPPAMLDVADEVIE
jgi:putative tryptophan/tyrosine transport system substrate-binding protein